MTKYLINLYELRGGYWQPVRHVESHTDKQAAREAVKRLQGDLPHGGILQCYGIAAVEI